MTFGSLNTVCVILKNMGTACEKCVPFISELSHMHIKNLDNFGSGVKFLFSYRDFGHRWAGLFTIATFTIVFYLYIDFSSFTNLAVLLTDAIKP